MSAASALAGACGASAGPTEATSSLYVRADSDDTTIIAPTVRVTGQLAERVQIDAAYTVDAWTGASVDVTTAATQAIVEQRHELDTSVAYQRDDVTYSAGYRYSTEIDYQSHGLAIGAAVDLAQKNTRLAVTGFGSVDEVGRAGDPLFAEGQLRTGGRATLGQVLDARTIADVSWETLRIGGFQASPYRWVALGGDGVCAGTAPLCVPERVPDERYRHALGARVRRALGARLSAGLTYRFYIDSWGVQSHTLHPDLSLLVGARGTLSARYRYYTQGEAGFYRPRYDGAMITDGWVTRDRKLSAFYAHELGAAYVHELVLGEETVLTLGVRGGLGRIRYLAFVGLAHVDVVELTSLVGLRFP